MITARYWHFVNDFLSFKQFQTVNMRFTCSWSDRYPCLNDINCETEFDRHYIYHPAWGARILAQMMPEEHVDISSTLHFSTIVSAFIPTRFYDYRPAHLKLNNFSSETADLVDLPFDDQSINSISCMHVVEHIGLGRYGDSLDYDGDLKAISELKRVLALNGSLLFVVPIGGTSKIMFNAHRIYRYEQILEYFSELYLEEFSLVPDNPVDGGIVINASKDMADAQNYGCGCFWFRKK